MTDRPAPGYTPARGEAKFPDLTLHKLEPQPAPFRLLLWDLQPLPPPDALDPLGVHVPTFGPEQGSDPPIAISAILAGQADDRGRECLFIIPTTGFLALGRAMLACNSTGTSLGDSQFGLEMINTLPATGGA